MPLTTAVVESTDGPVGGVSTFLGLVRGENLGRRVGSWSTRRTSALALKVFARIEQEARAQWPSITLGLHHRTGRLEIGEASIAIVVASAHRGEAFAACRYAIERVKQIAADLEARALRRRRGLDRRRDRGSGR